MCVYVSVSVCDTVLQVFLRFYDSIGLLKYTYAFCTKF